MHYNDTLTRLQAFIDANSIRMTDDTVKRLKETVPYFCSSRMELTLQQSFLRWFYGHYNELTNKTIRQAIAALAQDYQQRMERFLHERPDKVSTITKSLEDQALPTSILIGSIRSAAPACDVITYENRECLIAARCAFIDEFCAAGTTAGPLHAPATAT